MEIIHTHNNTIQNEHLVLYDLIKLTNETNKSNLIQCIFISGLSHNECSPLSNSENYIAMCKHKTCSMNMNAFLPNVMFHLEKSPNIINPNEQTAKLVFPTGIKPCFNINNDTQSFYINETFTNNIITTLKGDRFYLYSIMFYIVFSFDEFKRFFDSMKFNIVSDNKHNYIGLPYAISIVTVNSNFMEMKPLLQELFYSFRSSLENTDTFDKDLVHLIYELPIPMKNSIMYVYLPFVKSEIYSYEIALSECDIQFKQSLFTYLSLDNIIMIFMLVLTEQKIIFVCDDGFVMYNVIEIFMKLIYPLKWVTTYIPVIPEDSTSYAQSFIPFIMGITKEVFDNRISDGQIEGGIYVVDINKDKIEYYEGEESGERKDIEKYCPYYTVLVKQLIKWENMKDKEIRECFVKCMYDMVGEYESYTTNVVNNNLFDQNMYVKNKDSLYEEFYRDVTSTQMFNQFIQSRRENDEELFKEFKGNNEKEKTNENENNIIEDNNNEERINDDNNNFSIHCNENNIDDNTNNVPSNNNIEHYHLYPYFFPKDKATYIHINDKISNYYSNLYYNFQKKFQSNKESFILSSDYFLLFQIIMKNYDKQTLIKRYLFYSSNSLFNDDDINDESNDFTTSNDFNESPPLSLSSLASLKREEYENKINIPSSNKHAPYKKQKSLINMVIECPITKESFDEILKPYQEQICDVLKDYMSHILVNSTSFKNSLQNGSKFFIHFFIRNEFAYMLYQEKFNENIPHELSESTFTELSNVVFYCLLNSNNSEEEYESLRLMTKSLFYYFRNERGGNVFYLYEDIILKEIVFDFWKEVKFWEYFYKENSIENPLDNQYIVLNDYMHKLKLKEILINYIQKKIFE